MKINIEISDASLYYKNSSIFNKLSFSIPRGKHIAILGPSGVGKTSLLRLLAGLISEDSSFSCKTNISLKSNIVYMSQSDSLLPWLSVLDNVLLGQRLRCEKYNKELAYKLLSQVGLFDKAKQLPQTLSAGMRQRVALARTLIENKPLVLLDEPFAALDVITRSYLQTLTSNLLFNKTLLLVTHDPLEALRMADIIYVFAGKPAKIIETIVPKTRSPRNLKDIEVLKLQIQLLEKLEQAYKETCQ